MTQRRQQHVISWWFRILALVALVAACDRGAATKTPVDAAHGRTGASPTATAATLRRDEMVGPFDSWLDAKHPERLGLDIAAVKGDGVTDDTEALQAAIDSIGTPYGGGEIPVSQCRPDGIVDACTLVATTPTEGFVKSRAAAECAKTGKRPACLKGIPGQPRNVAAARATVLYLPAGHYKISHTLKFYNRNGGLMIIGESPDSTTIEWAGAAWTSGHEPPTDNDADTDMLMLDGGQTWFVLRRIAFDGKGKARVGMNFGSTSTRGGGGGETMELTDLRLKNLAFGIFVGGPNGANDADSELRRSWFQNISKVGFTVWHYNALNWIISDSLFEQNGRAIVKNAGSVILYDNLFVDNDLDVEMRTIHYWAMRGNVSLRAVDRARQAFTGFMTSAFFRISEVFAFAGNLVVDPGATVAGAPQVQYWRQGPAYFVDNDFFLPNDVCAASAKANTTIKLGASTPPDWQKREPVAGGRLPEALDRNYVLAGNRCNGAPVLPTVGLGTARTIVPKVDVARTEPLPLGFTLADVEAQRTRKVADAAAREALHAHLPPTPKRIDPHDAASVFLIDVPAEMADRRDPKGLAALASLLETGIGGARQPENANKLHVLHFPHGHFVTSSTIELPADVAFEVLGDGMQSTEVLSTPIATGAPLLAVRGHVVKLTIADLKLHEDAPPKPLTVSTGLVEIDTDDTVGGHVFVEDSVASGREAGVQYQGLDGVLGVMDSDQIVGLHVAGGDAGTSAGVIMYGITAGGALGISPLYVSHKGRLVGRDMYSEQQSRAFDLTGGSGTFVLDNVTKMHIDPNAPIDHDAIRIGDFDGDVVMFNLVTERQLELGNPPPRAQTVTVLGGDVYSNDKEVRPRLSLLGPIATWSFASTVSCDGLLGVPAATQASALRLVERNVMLDGLFEDETHAWQSFTRNCQNITLHVDPAGADAQLARAFAELRFHARPRSTPSDDLHSTDVVFRRVQIESSHAYGLLVQRSHG